MKTRDNRIQWIDRAKFIGIFLVILGHCSIPVYLKVWIYSFHMPLFFFISGSLNKFNFQTSYHDVFRKKTRTLIIPYFFFGIVTYLFWLLVHSKYGSPHDVSTPFYIPLLGLFYSNGFGEWMVFNQPLWFLTCLFSTEILFLSTIKISPNYSRFIIEISICLLAGFTFSYLHAPRLPWGLNIALVSISFYWLGWFYANRLSQPFYEKWSKLKLLVMTLLFLILSVVLSFMNGRVDMNGGVFNNPIFYMAAASSGLFFVVLTAIIIPSNRVIEFWGRETLIILGFHLMGLSGIKFFIGKIFGFTNYIYEDAILANVMLSLLTLICFIPVIHFLNRYFPFLVGKKKAI